jgi:CheY-like chemotaxis protein
MLRILLVEDNEMNRDMLSRRLERKGFDVTVAPDGFQGLASARACAPDLILMDLSLPGIDGWEVTRLLKADPATRATPIIALTAHAMAGDRERAFQAGCDDYDIKPVEFPRLLAKIHAILDDRVDAFAPDPDGPIVEETPLDAASLGRLRHHLIGPLARIIGFSELLADDARAAGLIDRAQSLDAIRALGHQTCRAIDGVLLRPGAACRPPVDLDAFATETVKHAEAIIHACQDLDDATPRTLDSETFVEELVQIKKDADLLATLIRQSSPDRTRIVG